MAKLKIADLTIDVVQVLWWWSASIMLLYFTFSVQTKLRYFERILSWFFSFLLFHLRFTSELYYYLPLNSSISSISLFCRKMSIRCPFSVKSPIKANVTTSSLFFAFVSYPFSLVVQTIVSTSMKSNLKYVGSRLLQREILSRYSVCLLWVGIIFFLLQRREFALRIFKALLISWGDIKEMLKAMW